MAYTRAQLDEIAEPFETKALRALARGDMDEVRSLLVEMREGAAGLDGLSRHTLARKAAKLRRDFGEARAREALKRIATQLMTTWAAQYKAGDEKGAIADLIAIYREQTGGVTHKLVEDDDRIVLDLTPCGAGGVLDKQGLPQKHPDHYGPWSDGVPTYCQICKAWQAALNEGVGADVWTTDKGEAGACRVAFHKNRTKGEALFDNEEREFLPRRRVDRAITKLDAGETDLAPLIEGQRKDGKPWHDFGVVCLEYFYAIALEAGGPDYLDEMLAQTYEPAFVAGFPRYAALSDEALAREIARTWNYHCADFTLSEEEDRFVFRLDPCGSGGRLYRGQMWRDMFHYGAPLSPIIPAPHPIDFNRANAPSYCTHCAASNRSQLSRADDPATPLFFIADGHAQMKPGEACRLYAYKKKAREIDPALFAQVGLAPKRRGGDRA